MYMAPAILESRDYSLKVNIWSLGIIYYQMLTGKTPFDADSADELREKVKLGDYWYPRGLMPTLESVFLISKCLQNAEEQILTASQLIKIFNIIFRKTAY
jgi:serine/threonine protein kinase